MEFLFGLDAQLLFNTLLMIVSIFFLFLAMSYLLFNPVRKMLEDRQAKIASDIDTAIADKEEAAKLKAEYEANSNISLQTLAEKYNIGYIDVQAVFDEYLKTGSCYILSGDRVHPKSVGISIIARTIYNHPDFRVILHD